MDTQPDALTRRIKQCAREMGADLIGIAPVSRYDGAPRMLRPQAHLPEAKSVISMAIHHTDGSVEWTGEPNPNYPAAFQIGMIPKLDMLSFRIGKMLEQEGYNSIPLPCTTYWRHRKYKDVPFCHAATFSHMNAFIAAGLGEYGWHGIVMSPQYGPRQRLISIITEAPLVPDPLYRGEPLCDRCMQCAEHCPGKNYQPDRLNDPPFVSFQIEGRTFEYPSINRWRCFYGEQAHLDMTKLSQIDDMDEEKLYEAVKNGVQVVNHGYACNSFKYCMAKPIRVWDKAYGPGPRRKKSFVEKSSDELLQTIRKIALASGADCLSIDALSDFTGLKANFHQGFRTEAFFQNYNLVITLGRSISRYKAFGTTGDRNRQFLEAALIDRISAGIMDISRYLDDLGYDAIQDWTMTGICDQVVQTTGWNQDPGKKVIACSVICKASLPLIQETLKPWGEAVTNRICKNLPFLQHIDQLSIGRVRDVILQGIEPFRTATSPPQTLIALSIGLPERVVALAGKQEADDGSAYAFANAQAQKEALWAAQDLADYLEDMGYTAITITDFTPEAYPTIGKTGRNMPDLRTNAPYAAAAGLGQIGKNGLLLTSSFGPRQRFVFVLTNAIPAETEIYQEEKLCADDCSLCCEACPMQALDTQHTEQVTIRRGTTYQQARRNEEHCAWARSFAMVAAEGSDQLGWKIPSLPVPDHLDQETIQTALEQKDPIQRIFYKNPNFTDIVIERCLQVCPVGKKKA